jgi:hypothetical protein
MSKLLLKITSVAALAIFGFAIIGSAEDGAATLRKVNCATLTVFAPVKGASADDLCRAHGGLAVKGDAPANSGLVILVRNQPMGDSAGLQTQ